VLLYVLYALTVLIELETHARNGLQAPTADSKSGLKLLAVNGHDDLFSVCKTSTWQNVFYNVTTQTPDGAHDCYPVVLQIVTA
jgi:hypothetical protein